MYLDLKSYLGGEAANNSCEQHGKLGNIDLIDQRQGLFQSVKASVCVISLGAMKGLKN
jgi:hypothetical protein